MESINWQEQLIIRLPRFPIPYFDQGMEVIWRNEVFRAALRIANPSWLEQIDWEQDFHQLPLKLQHTLWKYANRMCHRSTPFGGFTGMGVWTWDQEARLSINPVAFETRYVKRVTTSNPVQPYVNPLTYPFGEGLRFFVQQKDHTQNPWMMKEIPALAMDTLKETNLDKATSEALIEAGLLQNRLEQIHFHTLKAKDASAEEEVLAHSTYTSEGRLSFQQQLALSKGVKILEKLSLPSANPALQVFKNNFLKRYEYRMVPILSALDPDLGIGYPVQESPKLAHTWNPLHAYLMEQWLKLDPNEPQMLSLIGEEIPSMPRIGKKEIHHTAVFFSVLKDRLWLQQLAPLGAIPLIARMIPFDGRIAEMVDQWIAIEDEEEGVLHADILYQGESIMEKVSYPLGLRSYQLCISPQRSSSLNALNWNELVIGILGGELILYSLKYRKRVIPHLNSAYNVHRDELPLFRLLVDLQYEGMQIPRHFHLKNFFPDFKFYPRVIGDGVLLQPACWILKAELLKKWNALNSQQQRLAAFQDYAQEVNLPQQFFWKVGDQGLVFDRRRTLDMQVFQTLWSKYPEMWLEEYTFESGSGLTAQNEEMSYAHECLAFIRKASTSPSPKKERFPEPVENAYPDEDWVSYQVYLDTAQQDRFLTTVLVELLKAPLTKPVPFFSRWYFLRYEDELGPHLRIRFQRRQKAFAATNHFHKLLLQWEKLPFVKKVTLNTYVPETFRYRYLGIADTELLFQQSSIAILYQHLNLAKPDQMAYALCSLWQLYLKCPELLNEIENIKLPSGTPGQQNLMRTWNDEFRIIKPLLVENYPIWAVQDPFFKAIAATQAKNGFREQAPAYYLSIYHMHINRLFQTHQVQRERSCYYLFPKMIAFFKAKGISVVADERG